MERPKPPSPKDLGRRLAAARAYRKIDQIPAARKLKTGPDTLGRYENEGVPEPSINNVLERAPAAFDLPRAFFVIDFAELEDMSDAWDNVKKLRQPLRDLERLVEEELDGGSQS